MSDSPTSGPQTDPESPADRKMTDYLGMGTLIGLGAAIGILFGLLLDQPAWGMLGGAAAGTVIGAIVEAQRKK